jgi:hypothetical protein
MEVLNIVNAGQRPQSALYSSVKALRKNTARLHLKTVPGTKMVKANTVTPRAILRLWINKETGLEILSYPRMRVSSMCLKERTFFDNGFPFSRE